MKEIYRRVGAPRLLRTTSPNGQHTQERENPKHRQDHRNCQTRTEETSTDRADWLVVCDIRLDSRCARLGSRKR
jgi:hypothetical protein